MLFKSVASVTFKIKGIEKFIKYRIVMINSGEKFRSGAICEHRHHHARVTLGRKSSLYPPCLQAAVDNCESTGFVIRSNHHKCLAILFREFDYVADHIVKVEHFFNDLIGVVSMSPIIYLRPFNHEKETLFILVQNTDGGQCRALQLVATTARP